MKRFGLLAREEAEQSAAARFYSDVAESRLFAACAEFAAGEHDAAKLFWMQACRLLVAYAWHKDITIYELLDPFPALTVNDPKRARQRLPSLQDLCERAWQHTDGKETRGAPARWWKLLAAADPVALVDLVCTPVHAACNDPDDHLHDALAELWRAWNDRVDRFVAAALRVSLSLSLDHADPGAVERLAQTVGDPRSASGRLLAAYLAHFDERPPKYIYTNSDELVASDDSIVASIRVAALAAGTAPPLEPLPVLSAPPTREDPFQRSGPATAPDLRERLATMTPPAVPAGSVDLARAGRAWQSRAYDDAASLWAPDRAANVLGYRPARNGRV